MPVVGYSVTVKRPSHKPLSHFGEPHENLLRRSTVESDRKFWSGERPISVVQGLGLAVIFFGLIALIGVKDWPKGEAPLWEKMVDAYGAFIAVFGCAVLFLVLANRRFRRKAHSREKD